MTTSSLEHLQTLGHVIVIDDDASVRRSLCTMLERAGYEVSLYDCADAFLANPVVPKPSVILLDMQMPDMTGVELQEQLVKLGRKTPIVFVSGQSHPHQIVQGLKKGAVDFLFKPFNLEELLKAIADAIEFDRRQLKQVSVDIETKREYESLTPREREVCTWLVEGQIGRAHV